MLIQNGVVHTMETPVILNGYVELEGGKIKSVGPMEERPTDYNGLVLDAEGGHILPGFVDAHCHLGMFGDALGFGALDGVNPLDRCFQEAREGGVTTVLTGPGSANPISGQGVVMKTLGTWADQMVLKGAASMKMALGENPKSVYNERKETPITRMGTAAIIRSELARAVEYLDRQNKADAEEDTEEPDYDPKLEALLPVLKGEIPVHIHAHRADDIATAQRICREYGLKYVLVHGTEGHLVAEQIACEGVPVITGPILTDRCKPELANQTIENPALLHKAGVEIAICTDHPVTPIQYLPLCAALAVRGGLDPEEALRAITLNGAKLAGVADRVGSLRPGKDADVVVTKGHPLDWMGRVEHVFIGGQQVK